MAPTRPPRSTPRRPKPRGAGSGAPSSSRDAGPAERIAKAIARSGLASRREAEGWIADGRVAVNGRIIDSPALDVTRADRIEVDGEPLPERERTRLWLYHKPRGLVTTERDPEGRPTVFEKLPRELPRVLSVGRLDINSEGLLLLTNDGGLKRALELPSTGWLRRYKVRAFGTVRLEDLVAIENGVTVDGVEYGPVEARIERRTGDNVWLIIGIREGKNREVRNILRHLGLEVNRLIRLSYGPFQLRDLAEGEVEEVRLAVLREQLGPRIIEAAGIDLAGPIATAPPAGAMRRRKAAAARYQDYEPTDRRATAKAERFARLQAGEAEDMDMSDDDTPDVEIDPSTGKITLKEKTVADRKGRRVKVGRKFDEGKTEERRRRPRVLGEGGEELPRRERPERRQDEAERPRRRPPEGARTHSFRERRPAPGAEEGLRRPRREDERGEGREGGESRGFKSAGYRDRGEAGGERPRKSFGYKSQGGPREERGERRPYRPREEREGGGERRPYRPREEGGGERRPYRPREEAGGERRAWRPRIDREEGGEERPRRPREEREGGGERRPYRPREEREGGGERRPYRPRERAEASGGERRDYRPRREEGGEERPRRPYRPREEGEREGRGPRPFRPRTERREEGGERRPYRPREERGEGREERPRRPYRPRGEGEGGPRGERPFRPRGERSEGGGGSRPYRPRGEGGEGRPYRPRGEGGERGEGRPYRPGGPGRGPRPGGGPGRGPRPGGGPRSGGPRGPRKPRGDE